MDKRFSFFICISLLLLCVLATFSEAVEVVVIKSAEIRPYNEAVEGFRSSFDDDIREIALTDMDRGEVVRNVRTSGADAVLAVGIDALNLAKSISGIPVIYTMVPPSYSLNSAGRPLSGVNMYIPPKSFISSIHDAFHWAKRIGAIYDPANSETFIKEAMQSAHERGLELVLRRASRPAEVPAIIDSMKDKIDVFWMLPDATVVNPEAVKYLLLFSFQNKVPVFTFSKKYVEMGAAAGLYASPFDMGAQAGEIARRLVSEKSLRAMRVDVKRTVLVVNQKVVTKLGIRMKEDVLKRAEHVD